MARAKITIRNLTKRYLDGSVLAFENLNLEVLENEILCILGPRGCGKTTLLKILDGLMPPDGGEVRIDGEPVQGGASLDFRVHPGALRVACARTVAPPTPRG